MKQEDRDEWTAFILQLGLQDDLSELAFVDRTCMERSSRGGGFEMPTSPDQT